MIYIYLGVLTASVLILTYYVFNLYSIVSNQEESNIKLLSDMSKSIRMLDDEIRDTNKYAIYLENRIDELQNGGNE